MLDSVQQCLIQQRPTTISFKINLMVSNAVPLLFKYVGKDGHKINIQNMALLT